MKPGSDATKISDMEIVWLGHSCFRITLGEIKIYLDPIKRNHLLGTLLEPRKESRASAILVSHEHWDHYNAETIMELCDSETKIYCTMSVASALSLAMSFEAKDLNELRERAKKISLTKKGDIFKIGGMRIKSLEASEGLSYLLVHNRKRVLFMGDSTATRGMMMERPNVILFPTWAVKGEEARLDEFLELAIDALCMPMHYHTSQTGLPNFYIAQGDLKKILPRAVRVKLLKKKHRYRL